MALDRIQIDGFKSIREADLSLRALNVLIGANGAGKSNLMGAFGLLRQLVEAKLQVAVARAGGASTLLHRGPKVSTSSTRCDRGRFTTSTTRARLPR
jgi:predicted ATPase